MAWNVIANIKGPTGATGNTGAQGPQGNPGIGFTWRGTWSGSTAYAINDAVSRTNQSYVCTVANTGNDPATDTTHWNLMAAQGATGPAGPSAVSTDPNNLATLGSDNLIAVPAANIWSVRLRSYNAAIGNPSFEVDQANVGSLLTNAAGGARLADRWFWNKVGTMAVNSQQLSAIIPVPGTNFAISTNYLRLTLTGQEASLGASDFISLYQFLEGPQFRELINDVHSIQVLVRSSVAPLKFGISLADFTTTKSLTKLATISTANTWTILPFPNLPIFPAGNFTTAPGTAGQIVRITLAAGSSRTNTANDVWVTNSGTPGALGQDNWCAQAVNATFDIAFVQWEPGPLCTTLIDKPFQQNYDECLRYYQKTYDYETAIGTATGTGILILFPGTGAAFGPVRFHKPMAKIPTLTAYNHATGAANSTRLSGTGTDYTVSGFSSPGKAGYYGIAVTSAPAPTVGQGYWLHHTADTGW
jgi:hypothetical protein